MGKKRKRVKSGKTQQKSKWKKEQMENKEIVEMALGITFPFLASFVASFVDLVVKT